MISCKSKSTGLLSYLKLFLSSLVLLISLLLISTTAVGATTSGKIILTFEKPTGNIDKELADFIIKDESLRESINIVNKMTNLKKDIHIVFRNDPKNKSPFYNRKADTVYFSYGFMSEHHKLVMASLERFNKKYKDLAYSEDEMLETADNEVIDFTHYVLFHELGHAIIDVNKLPIVGSEEVAADNLATILILDTFGEKTAQQIINASRISVGLLQSKSLSFSAAASQHAASTNRIMDMLCLVVGKYPRFAKKLGQSNNANYNEYVIKRTKPKICKPFYEYQNKMWLQLLSGNIDTLIKSGNGKLTLDIQPTKNPLYKKYYNILKKDKALPALLQKAGSVAKLPVNITVLFTDKIKRNQAFFDSKKNMIVYPYQALLHLTDIYDEQTGHPGLRDETSYLFSYNSIYFTIMLKLAEAIIDLRHMPITGGKALATKQLAAILTLNFSPTGLINTFLSKDALERKYQYDSKHNPIKNVVEHNAVGMLAFNHITGISCLAYGKDPKAALAILKQLVNKKALAYYEKNTNRCVGEYKYQSRMWLKLLQT